MTVKILTYSISYNILEVSDPAISVLAEGFFFFFLSLSLSFIPVKRYDNADVQKLALYLKKTKANQGFLPHRFFIYKILFCACARTYIYI